MDFSPANSIHGVLPQFSEITSKSAVVSSVDLTEAMQQAQNAIYTNAAASINHAKQQSIANQHNKYPANMAGWPDANTLMQLCEKQAGIQTINIPNYNSQNNSTLLGVQSNGMPLRIIPNMYLPAAMSEDSTAKPELPQMRIGSAALMNSNTNSSSNTVSQLQLHQHSAVMAEYLQKLQATTLPLTLQQLIKLQSEPLRRDKIDEDEKLEQTANNILNIPSVSVFRNGQHSQNGNNQYMTTPNNMMMEINAHELQAHMDDSSSPVGGRSGTHTDSQTQTPSEHVKPEPPIQTDATKAEKKMKFRAKTGEIKIALGLDGSMLYCCPECSLAFSDKIDIELHIQNHVQERKYQCKECGAMLKRKEHLDQHMRGHSDERPFKCPVCLKAFKRNEHLTRHYVIHSGDKNFTCTVCAKAFSRKDHLNKHTQTHLGIKRVKSIKKEATTMENGEKDMSEISSVVSSIDEASLVPKQELSFLQHIHHLQKIKTDDQHYIQSFSAFKEQTLKDGIGGVGGGMLQQQAVNMNEILPQNARYLMPS